MEQDFLEMVGKCREHEGACDESASAEKIYDNVVRKIALCEKRRKRRKTLICVVSGLAATAAIFCLFVSPWKNSGESNQVTQIQDKNHDTIEKENAKVVFCVYEAQQRNQTVMANYMSMMKKREMETEKEIELGTYNPLTSTVPGYPVMVSNSKSKEMDVEFSITTSEGQLLQWNQETGEVKELGNSGTFKGNEKIFWSPLSNGKLVKETKINVDLFVMKHLEDNVNVKITMEAENAYKAKRIK